VERFDRMVNWRILAVVACMAFVAQPGRAAEQGKPTPHADAAQGGAPSGATAPGEGKTEADAADHNPTHPASNVRGRIKGPGTDAGHAGVASGATPGPPPSIDLVRPDDGYTNLRRRAARASLIAGHKNLAFGRPAVPPHLPSVGPLVEPTRTATGTAVPAGPAFGKPDGFHPSGTVPGIAPKNNLGLAATEVHRPDMPVVPHVTPLVVSGINGTTMGHTTPSSIGGAAKDRSAIAGTSYRHR
jgi:hypothetical protein